MEAKIETKGGDAWIHVAGGHVDGSDVIAVVRAGSYSLHVESQGGRMALPAYEAVAKAAESLGVVHAQAWLAQAQWSLVEAVRDQLPAEVRAEIEAIELACPALAAQIASQALAKKEAPRQ